MRAGVGASGSELQRAASPTVADAACIHAAAADAQGCRPLSAAVFTIDEVAAHSSVVLALRDAKGQQLSPVEALQRELRQVRARALRTEQQRSNLLRGEQESTLCVHATDIVAAACSLQAASSRSELLLLLRNIALGLMPETLRPADEQPLEPQDFLIRGMALDRAGFMVVGDAVRVGQRVRFMVSAAGCCCHVGARA